MDEREKGRQKPSPSPQRNPQAKPYRFKNLQPRNKPTTMTRQLTKSQDFRQNYLCDFHLCTHFFIHNPKQHIHGNKTTYNGVLMRQIYVETLLDCCMYKVQCMPLLSHIDGGSFRRTSQSPNTAQRSCCTGPPVYIGWNRVHPMQPGGPVWHLR